MDQRYLRAIQSPSPFDPDGFSEHEIGIESAPVVDRLAERQ